MKFSHAFQAAVMMATAQALDTRYTTPEASFKNMSMDRSEWIGANTVGCILGFVVFGLMYLYTIVMILIDTCKRGAEYDALIENDIAEMQRLGMDTNKPDFVEGLKNRLAGVKEEDKGDDQLFGSAAKLTADQWRNAM